MISQAIPYGVQCVAASPVAGLCPVHGSVSCAACGSVSGTRGSTALLGTSEILKVDPEGRVILTETLKTYAGLSSEVVFVGQGHKFQIWEPGRFRAHLDEARSRVRDLRKQLSARYTTERS